MKISQLKKIAAFHAKHIRTPGKFIRILDYVPHSSEIYIFYAEFAGKRRNYYWQIVLDKNGTLLKRQRI